MPLGGKPKHVGGASDFDALLDIIEEDENNVKRRGKGVGDTLGGMETMMVPRGNVIQKSSIKRTTI